MPAGPNVEVYSPPQSPKKPSAEPECMKPMYPASIEQPTMRHMGTTIARSATASASAIMDFRLLKKRITSLPFDLFEHAGRIGATAVPERQKFPTVPVRIPETPN